MISLCKKLSKEELFRCSFNLSKTEYKVFSILWNDNRYDIKALTRKARLDRTTIQKAIKILIEKGLVKRRKVKLSKGGIKYVYTVNNKKMIKKKMKRLLLNWFNNVKKEIEKL